ncbi:MAG: esterase-like activity of phytase family protein [Rhodospirillaceae bacterium]|nr:esterase-like activity of phytase family protein [Rhodospirillaceae bacterium]
MAGCYSPADPTARSIIVLSLLRPLCLAALGLALAFPAAAQSTAEIDGLRFIGAVTVPNDQTIDGTLVGGLSGIDYDPVADLWYLISDDKSDENPARFYTAKVIFHENMLAGVVIERAITLLQAEGQPYPDARTGGDVPDPESIRRDPESGNLWWTSEGDRKLGLSPFLRVATPDGKFAQAFITPELLRMNEEQEIGPRHNNGFEGLSFAPGGKSIWLAMESALYQDGPIATPSAGAVARLTRLDRDGNMLAQFAYPLDPIQAVPTGKNGDNGVSEILALDDHRALVLERSGVEGADGVWTMYIRLYAIDAAGATDIAAVPALANASYIPVSKRLVIDLAKTAEVGRVDNIEGMSWGPMLADGNRSLVLVSDNNFNPTQITQFLAFEVAP